ncbi:hypothetical protein AgCh_025557 [Apium graveolens]
MAKANEDEESTLLLEKYDDAAATRLGPERKVRVVITDQGGEFGSNKFKKFYEKDGITRHYIAPYTPQQNGVVERITPYEAWNEKKPQVGHIMVSGCISYMRIPSQKMSKLDDRSKPVVNMAESPILQSPVQQLNPEIYDDSAELKGIINLSEIYNETEEQQLDEELYLMGIEEPMNFVQAAKDINWKLAMKKEMQSIEENQTWKLSELPPVKKVIGLKWIFKLKKDAEGRIVKHKARLVPKGYVQERVVDFDEVFAPVTRPEMVHFILALASKNELEVHHLDVLETKLTWHDDMEADVAADVALQALHLLSDVAVGCYKLGSRGVGLGLQVHELVPKMVIRCPEITTQSFSEHLMLEDAAIRSNSYQEDLCPSQLRDADVSTSGGNTSCANDKISINDSLMMVVFEQRAPDKEIVYNKYEFQMQYGSIGWSVGATLGYSQAAKDKQIIVCIGDGSFQVTAQDVSTVLRCGQNQIIFLKTVVIVSYTIEVEIHDGPYNVIKNWNYTALVDAIHNGEGKCWTTKVRCEEDLDEEIETTIGEKKDFLCFIEVI